MFIANKWMWSETPIDLKTSSPEELKEYGDWIECEKDQVTAGVVRLVAQQIVSLYALHGVYDKFSTLDLYDQIINAVTKLKEESYAFRKSKNK
jgi:hypothetical protein